MRASISSKCAERFKELLEDEKINSKEKDWKCDNINSRTNIYIIGIGPGKKDYFTIKAVEVLKKLEVVVCYKKYLNFIRDLISKNCEIMTTGMKREIERAEFTIEMAKKGKITGIVSSGDAGIYGMAGLILELLERKNLINKLIVEIIPGVSSINASSSLLGAPIMHDFCVISLSDLLTDWEIIEKRLKKACEGDFVIGIYNPRSKTRKENFRKAIEIIKSFKKNETPVGIVKNAYRENQEIYITSLENILNYEDRIDMNCTIIIGNSNSKILNFKYILTPRGYFK